MTKQQTIPNVLTIAGSDSGGGAGIQADIKSISANHAYAASVLTAITAQNTHSVTDIHDVPIDMIRAQMDAVFHDIDISAVKIGMLSQSKVIELVAQGLKYYKSTNIVFDPVMVATSGDFLIADNAVGTIKAKLMPLADLITPNMHESARLVNRKVATNKGEMESQAKQLLDEGAKAVLIKGGHGFEAECADLLMTNTEKHWFVCKRINTQNTHGTGCSLSSAIAANLANGYQLSEAVERAKTWITGAIKAADDLNVGKGHGPIHHFHALW